MLCSRSRTGRNGSAPSEKPLICPAFLVLPERIELSTSPLPRECSTTELRQLKKSFPQRLQQPLGCKDTRNDAAILAIEAIPVQPRRAGACLAGQCCAAVLRPPCKRALSIAAGNSGMSKRGKADEQAARKERLSAALRENLKRRKQQARDRASAADRAGLGQAGLSQAMPGEVSQEDARAAEPVTDFRRNPGDE